MTKSKFAKGQSTFTCRCCKRLTRDTGGEGGVELCAQCYELAGLENELSDYGVSKDLVQSAVVYFEQLMEKGIKADTLEAQFKDLWTAAYAAKAPAETAPAAEAPAKVDRLARRRAASARRRAARKAAKA